MNFALAFELLKKDPNINDKEQDIVLNKIYNTLAYKANKMGFLSRCRLCGKSIEGKKNSHSIPQSILKNIILPDDNYYQITYILHDGITFGPIGRINKLGLNRTGTFHLLCEQCENETFKDYEERNFINNLSNGKFELLTDKILAEIMLKSALRERYKKEFSKNITILLNNEFQKRDFPYFISTKADKLSIDEDDRYINLCLDIINDKNNNNMFSVFYFDVLDHTSCFAGQPLLAIQKTVTEKIINDVYNYDSDYCIVLTQFVVFPIEKKTICLAFCLKNEYERIKPYVDYLKSLKLNTQRKLFQSTLFMYTEELYTNKSGIDKLKQDIISCDYIKKCLENATITEELLAINKLLCKPRLISPNNFRKTKFIL